MRMGRSPTVGKPAATNNLDAPHNPCDKPPNAFVLNAQRRSNTGRRARKSSIRSIRDSGIAVSLTRADRSRQGDGRPKGPVRQAFEKRRRRGRTSKSNEREEQREKKRSVHGRVPPSAPGNDPLWSSCGAETVI